MELNKVTNPIQSGHLPPSAPPAINQKSRSLTDWFVENQCMGSENMRKNFQQNTFRDDDGVLRYKENWLLAPEEGCSYLLPGSYEFSLSSREGRASTLTVTSEVSGIDTVEKQKASVKILFDWQLLWHHLANDNFDELAVHDDLLRASIDFFMHKKTMYMYWILCIYIRFFLDIFFTIISNGSILNLIASCLLFFIGGLYYFLLQRLYMGDGGIITQPVTSQNEETTSLNNGSNRLVDRRPKYMHWFGSLRHFIHLAFSEFKTLLYCGSRQGSITPVSDSEEKQHAAASFNQLMNIALKFLHIHCEINPRKLDGSRRKYKLAFLCLFAILSAFIAILIFYDWNTVIITCSDLPQYCNLAIINAVLRGGFIFNAALDFIFLGAVVIGIIGLSYGSTLAYFMASSWIKRYAGLRRIEGQTELIPDGDTNFNNYVSIHTYIDTNCAYEIIVHFLHTYMIYI